MTGMTAGLLIAFEGLDQSGKETQAQVLGERLRQQGRGVRFLSFPDYTTPIGEELARALRGERAYGPDVMQLLFIANRYEHRPGIERWLADGLTVICDRYRASSVAYGEAHGLDPAWLDDLQRSLPQPDLTILLDIAPDTALGRKTANRDRYERDLAMLGRVRESYRRQAARPGWVRIDGERSRTAVAADVLNAAEPRLARL
jgi:dTMP kinase